VHPARIVRSMVTRARRLSGSAGRRNHASAQRARARGLPAKHELFEFVVPAGSIHDDGHRRTDGLVVTFCVSERNASAKSRRRGTPA
jgi:hypothetical protein